MPNRMCRIIVGVVFIVLYVAFCIETAALIAEFQADGLWFKLALIYSHNFLFFPIAGLVALVAFYRPAVMVADALSTNSVRGGRIVLGVGLAGAAVLSLLISGAFSATNARSTFEVAPQTILADDGEMMSRAGPPRSPVLETLMKLRVQAADDEGLTGHRSSCEADWLVYAPFSEKVTYCFVAGENLTAGQCCQAKMEFRRTLNAMHADTPSGLVNVHRAILPIKIFFLLMLLGLGVLLVQLRKRLTELYGAAVESISYPLAVGGAVMLLWPFMNAAYLESFELLTGDGTANAYKITAPLFSFGFGAWAVLLIFFHLRSYPSQLEYAAKFGGLVIAGFGVFQYEEIISYVSRTLGAGGGVVSVVVFIAISGGLIVSVLKGVRPQDMERGLKSATLIGDGALDA